MLIGHRQGHRGNTAIRAALDFEIVPPRKAESGVTRAEDALGRALPDLCVRSYDELVELVRAAIAS